MVDARLSLIGRRSGLGIDLEEVRMEGPERRVVGARRRVLRTRGRDKMKVSGCVKP